MVSMYKKSTLIVLSFVSILCLIGVAASPASATELSFSSSSTHSSDSESAFPTDSESALPTDSESALPTDSKSALPITELDNLVQPAGLGSQAAQSSPDATSAKTTSNPQITSKPQTTSKTNPKPQKPSQKTPKKSPLVAVVADSATYANAASAIDSYISSMAVDGKRGLLLIDRWGVPDSLRAALKQLYVNEMLEGAVLVGDIPIPMIRDAQHLSSAFKMDQRRAWQSSSVPSDRYYDDFDLEFRFLKQDDARSELFYYSLSEESPQKIESDIYTSRIKPAEGIDKYKAISDFLLKAVRAKEEAAALDRVMFFAGHGYNSESMISRMAEYKVLYEQFPILDSKDGRLDFINFDFDASVKTRLLAALSEPEMDVAILHHHGYNDMQLLNGSPYVSSPNGWLDLARNYFRVKMRSARNKEKTREDFIKRFGIPESWLDEANDPVFAAQDSLYERSMDIYPDDIDSYDIAARFVIFDACFNGEFTESDYVVSHYLFGENNKTLSAIAHSVNSLQDVWCDELVGLLGEGVCTGNIFRHTWNLETHLFGDPTFHFSKLGSIDAVAGRKGARASQLRKIIATEGIHSDVKSLAVKLLAQSGAVSAEELLSIEKENPSPIVRLAAFNALIGMAPDCFNEAVLIALDDDYELLQRLGARYACYNQSPSLARKAVELYLNPLTSKRVMFHLKSLVTSIDKDLCIKLIEQTPYWKGEDAKADVIKYVEASDSSTKEDILNLSKEDYDKRSARLFLRAQRNQCRTDALDAIGEFYSRTADPELKLQIAELMGWYRYSYRRGDAVRICKRLLESESDSRLKEELTRSVNRLTY